MTYKYVPDTNVLMERPEIVLEYPCVILTSIMRELDKHIANKSREPELAFKARQARNFIYKHIAEVSHDLKDYTVSIDGLDNDYVDNKIIEACKVNNYGLITYDKMLKLKAHAVNDTYGCDIDVIELDVIEDTYTGYIELKTDEELATYIQYGGRNIQENVFGLLPNQYLIVPNAKGRQGDILRWTGSKFVSARHNSFSSIQFGDFKPRDAYQHCALDSLMNNQMTMIKGKAGSGKSKLALEYSWKQVEEKGKKLIIFCNPVASRNSARLGFYKGDRNTKLLDSTVGTMLGAKFGSKQAVADLIEAENAPLMLLPFSDIRGFDTTGMNAIVWIVEAQNLDIDLMKLAIQRCGDDTQLIIDGDYNSQVDMEAYAGSQNGMRRVSQVFRGVDFYGEVELPIIYRSKMAAKAEEM